MRTYAWFHFFSSSSRVIEFGMSLIAFAFLLSSHLREAPALLSCSHVKRRDKKSGEKLPLLRGSSIILEDFDEAKAKIRAKGIHFESYGREGKFCTFSQVHDL